MQRFKLDIYPGWEKLCRKWKLNCQSVHGSQNCLIKFSLQGGGSSYKISPMLKALFFFFNVLFRYVCCFSFFIIFYTLLCLCLLILQLPLLSILQLSETFTCILFQNRNRLIILAVAHFLYNH